MASSLADLGWQESARLEKPVTRDGQPLPWFTYAATAWLDARMRSNDRVFEFGAGQSTLWFAGRAGQVHSVEHDPEWAAHLGEIAPANVTIAEAPDPGEALDVSDEHPYLADLVSERDDSLDIIVVDARARLACLRVAVDKVRRDGLVVLDNSDRPRYRAGVSSMHQAGFGRIDFLGSVPGSGRLSVTSMFLRDPGRWLAVDPPLRHVGYE